MPDSTLVLIDLNSQASFEFQYFPNEVKSVDRSNWEAQEVTIGTKPLFYQNREPQVLTFSELYFDTIDGNAEQSAEFFNGRGGRSWRAAVAVSGLGR